MKAQEVAMARTSWARILCSLRADGSNASYASRITVTNHLEMVTSETRPPPLLTQGKGDCSLDDET